MYRLLRRRYRRGFQTNATHHRRDWNCLLLATRLRNFRSYDLLLIPFRIARRRTNATGRRRCCVNPWTGPRYYRRSRAPPNLPQIFQPRTAPCCVRHQTIRRHDSRRLRRRAHYRHRHGSLRLHHHRGNRRHRATLLRHHVRHHAARRQLQARTRVRRSLQIPSRFWRGWMLSCQLP
jgi:hypothetical protein